MSQSMSPLYAKLLGETARIAWKELEPFFARGLLLLAGPGIDLPAVAEALAEDDREQVSVWLAAGQLRKLEAEDARVFADGEPQLWAVVVAPWVLVQDRSGQAGARS